MPDPFCVCGEKEETVAMAYFIGKTEDGQDIYGMDFDIEVKEAKQTEDGKRVISMIGSTPSVDRDGDTINQSGWDLRAFRSNPVVQWAHSHAIPAIGRANKFIKSKESLDFQEIEFPKEGIHPFADMIYALLKDKFIRMCSVGFIPLKHEKREVEDDEKDRFWSPRNFIKQELLELSICNVGSNRDALVYLQGKGFKGDDVNKLFDSMMIQEKRVIPYKQTPKDPEDATWNGPKEVAAAEVSDLKIMCTWVDPDNDEIKSGYKLPHHRASGHNTVWKGVAAAMAALLGARGGVEIPEGERKRVHGHLAKHYKEWDKPVPDFKEYSEAELEKIFPDAESCVECDKTLSIKPSEKFVYESKQHLCRSCLDNLSLDWPSLVTKELAEKPYANEHACRLKSPDQYDSFARKNCAVKHDGKCIDHIYGIKDGKSDLQAMRYPRDVWSATDARAHCKDKGGAFEAAKEAASECLECGKAVSLESGEQFTCEGKCPLCEGCFDKAKGTAKIDLSGLTRRFCVECNKEIDFMKKDTFEINDDIKVVCIECVDIGIKAGAEIEPCAFCGNDVTSKLVCESCVKAGAVLNRANKKKLRDAMRLIGEVLASSEPAVEDGRDATDTKSQPPEEVDFQTLNVEQRLAAFEVSFAEGIRQLRADIAAYAKFTGQSQTADKDEIDLDDDSEAPDEINLEELELSSNPEKDKDEIDLGTTLVDGKQFLEELGKEINQSVTNVVTQEFNRVTGKVD